MKYTNALKSINRKNRFNFNVIRQLVFFSLLLVLCNNLYSQIRIMPLGESTTAQNDSYRKALSYLLVSYNVNFDFVGSVKSNGVGYDVDNQGIIGTPCSGITTWFNGNYKEYPADIILLWEGTNDCHWASQGTTITKLSELIDTISSKMPLADVFVSTIPPIKDATSNVFVTAYNDTMPGLIQVKKAQGLRVHFVDARGVITADDLIDNLHPSGSAYTKMSPLWFNAIRPLLNITDVDSVSFTDSTYYINLKGSKQLSAIISPINASNKKLSWLSAHPTIAKVTSAGKVFALSTGITTITATSSDKGKIATCTVHVVDSSTMAVHTPVVNPFEFYTIIDSQNQELEIHFNSETSGTFILFNTKGILMKKSQFKTPTNQLNIDISSLPVGVYFFKIQSENNIISKKITKNN